MTRLSTGHAVLVLACFAFLQFVSLDDASSQAIPEPSPAKSSAADTKPLKDDTDNRVYQSSCPALLTDHIVGKVMPPIIEGQCGERSPIEVVEIGGLKLSSPAILNCKMAESLTNWISELNPELLNTYNRKITDISVGTHYQCRRRNNLPTGKLSEHGFANALDIVGFTFDNGERLTVEEHWGPTLDTIDTNASGSVSPDYSQQIMRTARDIACKHFTTVLGPESDAYHNNHFHLDLGCHGKNCTYMICE